MSEIEKMYENAGIAYEERYNNCTLNKEGQCELKCSCDICKYSEERYIYPPFTAEKQIELICFLLNADIKIDICKEPNMKMEICDIAEALAEVTNTIWQDLSEEEKQQVKGILE